MTFRDHVILGLAAKAPHCFGCGKSNDGDVVAAHRNEGKAMGSKNPDFMVAFLGNLCCHAPLDQGKDMSREDRRAFWDRAYWATMEWLWTSGHVMAFAEPQPLRDPPPRIKRKVSKGRPMQSRPFDKSGTPRKIEGGGFSTTMTRGLNGKVKPKKQRRVRDT